MPSDRFDSSEDLFADTRMSFGEHIEDLRSHLIGAIKGVLFILVISIALRHNALESLLFAVALAVGLTPEFLPMITTVTLTQGAVRMARRKVIVKLVDHKDTPEGGVAACKEAQNNGSFVPMPCLIHTGIIKKLFMPLIAAVMAPKSPA